MAKPVEYIVHYLKEKGFNIRFQDSPPRIYLRNSEGQAKFQLMFWQGDYKGEISIRIISASKYPSYNAKLGRWFNKNIKHKLFTINLYNPSSISKLDKWLEENKSKLM